MVLKQVLENEETRLLESGNVEQEVTAATTTTPRRPNKILPVVVAMTAGLLLWLAVTTANDGYNSSKEPSSWMHPQLARMSAVVTREQSTSDDSDDDDDNLLSTILVESRCPLVEERFFERDGPDVNKEFGDKYAAQATDFNVFYRATAHIFWHDYANGPYGKVMKDLLEDLEVHLLKSAKDIPLGPKSTWTWVTGDQHLSNFGAWRNRHGEVVFSVNDFDESAIFDFHIDVLRIAVSICNHALANGFTDKQTDKALKIFMHSYVEAVMEYVGNEDALLFELTPKTSFGVLKKFLKKTEKKNSASKQLKKFTDVLNGTRFFVKGGVGVAHEKTKLADVPPEVDAEVRATFSSTHYGASMLKLGWNVRQWDDNFFQVLDVAERVGSGIGSFGVSRYYVLLKGTDDLLDEEDDGNAVILDVKYEPLGAVERILSQNDLAWYNTMFPTTAARAAEGQRRLTSYVDPFTGWVMLKDENGNLQPFGVRQRSPWKDSIDLDEMTDPKDFYDFTSQIALATATSHVRGSVAKAPADFKHVIHAIMKEKSNKNRWGNAVTRLAQKYHKQVLLDYECFAGYIQDTYNISANDEF